MTNNMWQDRDEMGNWVMTQITGGSRHDMSWAPGMFYFLYLFLSFNFYLQYHTCTPQRPNNDDHHQTPPLLKTWDAGVLSLFLTHNSSTNPSLAQNARWRGYIPFYSLTTNTRAWNTSDTFLSSWQGFFLLYWGLRHVVTFDTTIA